LIDKQGYEYSPETQAEIDAAIRAKTAELVRSGKIQQGHTLSISVGIAPSGDISVESLEEGDMSEDKKPYHKPELKRLNPEEVKAEFDAALTGNQVLGFASGGLDGEQKTFKVAYPRDRKTEYWDVRDYTQFFTEIIVFRMNQMSLGANTQEHYWKAQADNVLLRNKLQTAYVSAHQKAKMQKPPKGLDTPKPSPLEIWMFGAAAYELITEQGMKLEAVLEMSGAKLAELAAEQGELFKKKSEQEGDTVYMIRKKSREK
jgi:hypothetical protein